MSQNAAGASRRCLYSLYASIAVLWAAGPAPAWAAGPAVLAVQKAPAAAGQQALGVRVDAQGVQARVCASGECSGEGGTVIDVPSDAKEWLSKAQSPSQIQTETLVLKGGRHLIRTEVPNPAGPGRWVLLVAAPAADKGAEPLVLFNEITGIAKGEHGEGRSKAIVYERSDDQKPGDLSVRVVSGENREDVSICGRSTLVTARALDPANLTFVKGASYQNLSKQDRAKALQLKASLLTEPAAPGALKVLRATSASSAIDKKFATLTDGDRATLWSENKADLGRGEFVSLSAPSEVGITAIEFALPAESDEIASPRVFYLATDKDLFEVSVPDDANRKKGGVYEVKLPSELHTSCLAVVLESAFGSPGAKNKGALSLAEITARTPFDGQSLEALAGALAGGGDRSKAAAALLSRGDKAAVAAVIDAYPKLDESGQRLALDIIEGAPCSEQTPFFIGILKNRDATSRAKELSRGQPDPEVEHALDRIRRCGRAAAPALAGLIENAGERTKILAANELSLLAPGEAVPVLLKAIGASKDNARREFRRALSSAAKSERAKSALTDALSPEAFQSLSDIVKIDLLRAIGPRLGSIDGGAKAFSALAVKNAPFRTRYLLQVPAAELARAGDAQALAYLQASLRADPDPHVRLKAAEAAARVPALISDLIKAVGDPEVRVRESAVLAIGQAMSEGAAPSAELSQVLAKRLSQDTWTMIRAGAASALGTLPATPEADRSLAGALLDISGDVRGRALDALGAHKAKAYAEKIRERQDDPEELVEVRARAMLALASMCDTRSLEDWTKYAHRSIKPMDERERRMGTAAIAALGMIHPKDLKQRLSPLFSKDAPPLVREMAKAALSAESPCR